MGYHRLREHSMWCGCLMAAYLVIVTTTTTTLENVRTRYCRDRDGLFSVEIFNMRASLMCHKFLFKTLPETPYVFDSKNSTSHTPYINDETSLRLNCNALTEEKCHKWTLCFKEAQKCCKQQLDTPLRNDGENYCPRIWDGFGCWEDSPAGEKVTIFCPSYVEEAGPNKTAIKICQNNATWFEQNGTSWTDYTACLQNKDSYFQKVYIALGCNLLSLLTLIPGVIIFLRFRKLRIQQRIKIHINFFLSFIASNVINILFEILLTHDLLVSEQPLMKQNTVGCKIFTSLKLFLTSNNFAWMFCEAYYLHRLITNALNPPKNIILLCAFGWAFPAVPVITRSILRVTIDADTECWVRSTIYDWIIYVPNLACIAANLFFLARILFVMARLHSHPQDQQTHFRRALRATFILIPLFGLQLFVQVYNPEPGLPGAAEYSKIAIFIRDTQGFFVALLFCFFNKEVMQCLKDSFRGMRRGSMASHHTFTMTTRTSLSSSFLNFCRKRGSSAVSFGKQRGSTENESVTPKGSMPSIVGSQTSIKTTPKIAERSSQKNGLHRTVFNSKNDYSPVPTTENNSEKLTQI